MAMKDCSENICQGTPTTSSGDNNYKKDSKHMFVFFWKDGSCFSQFFPVHFTVDGQEFSCAEQYMMYQKAKCFNDAEIGECILHSNKPMQMKSLGRKVKNYDDDIWEATCFDVVKTGNRHKFSQNPELKADLFSTKGKILVEASPMDCKWGIGLPADNPKAWSRATWRGRNLLGYALTEVREELMKEEGLL